MSNQIIKHVDKRRVVRWIPFHLSSSLLLVHTNLQPFYLPSTFTILCFSKLPPTSDNTSIDPTKPNLTQLNPT